MNMLSRTVQNFANTRRHLTAAFLGLAVVAPMLAAAPALAVQKDVTVVISNGGFTFGLRSAPPVNCIPIDSWATREFERGQRAGRNEGFDAGYRDGLRGDCFDQRIRLDLCRLSRPFEDGYRSTFKRAYGEGFERGRCERLARLERERCERERQCQAQWNRGHGWGPPWRR